MNITRLLVILIIIVIPLLGFCLEFFLCKKGSEFAIIFPIIAACFFVIIGFYALIIAAIMFGIYFVMRHVEKEKQEKLSEIEKMNIEDL